MFTMDEGLRKAAEYGNIDALYALIQDDADILRRIDEMEFVDTPLHVAASAGNADFAMEIMNLKPSLARKLNQRGLTPLHLALQNEQTDLAIDLVSVDNNLVRVKGREGYTPLHYVSMEGNVHLLSQFLNHCPDSIFDCTTRKQNALHIAAQFNRLEAFKTILQRVRKTPEENKFQRRRILNFEDKDGNTVLHIAASNNQHKMIQLLIDCKEIDRNSINKRGLTASDILQQQSLDNSSRESVKLLNNTPSRFSKVLRREFEGKLAGYIKEMKPETINALLVVFTLVLAMTYQAILSPPGGAAGSGSGKGRQAKSVVNKYGYFMFHVPNGVAFFMAWILTLALFRIVASSILIFLYPIYSLMCLCYGIGMLIAAPSTGDALVVLVAIFIIFFLSTLICSCIFNRMKSDTS